MGLASAVWGGFFAALLGGSQYNIAGPTASGAGILAVYSLRYGYQILPFIAILSGLLMLAALALRLDKYVLLLPGGVMHGWTIGVAFTIAGNQLAAAFGVNNLTKHEQFFMNVFEVFAHLGQTQVGPFIVFLIAVTFIVSMGFLRPKIPWTIIVALIGILLGVLSSNDAWIFHMDTLNERYQGLKFSLFQTPTFKSTFFTGEILTASFSIAFISILESLLSAKVADRLTGTRFAQPLEVFGIAFANIIAGTFNGIPVTAALARTALNINSGATNRMAAILNGISCGVIALLLIKVLGYMPLAIIVALLVNVAIRMVNLANMTHLWLYDSTQFRIAVFTALVTIFMDPAQGIIYGAVVSIFLHGLHTAEAWSEITAGNDASPVVTHSSMELDRQALQDTFERQFPPTLKSGDELEMLPIPESKSARRKREREERHRRAARQHRRNSADGSFEGGGASDLEVGTMDTDDESDLEANVPLDPRFLDEDFVGLDEEYDSDDDEDAEHIANRVFISAPKYKADHLIIRFPGEISYLNAEQHADRLAPLLNTGRYIILHLKRTYYVDLDGMDMLTSLVHKVEKNGHHILLSGLTPQILPNMEIFDWFVRAREEGRIVPDYKNAILRIRELDTEHQRRLDEANYHDITAYEVEESRRHEQYMANVEAARVAREERAAREAEENRIAAEAKARREEEEDRNAAVEAERRQAAKDAKRRADAEEFQRRLEEYETTKKEREAQKAAYLAAAGSGARDGPVITVPHHHDHRQPPRRSSSSLKLAETPIGSEGSDSYVPLPSGTPAPEHLPSPTDMQDNAVEMVSMASPVAEKPVEYVEPATPSDTPTPEPTPEPTPAPEIITPEPTPPTVSEAITSEPTEIAPEPTTFELPSPSAQHASSSSVFVDPPRSEVSIETPSLQGLDDEPVVEEPTPAVVSPSEDHHHQSSVTVEEPSTTTVAEEEPATLEEPTAVEEPVTPAPTDAPTSTESDASAATAVVEDEPSTNAPAASQASDEVVEVEPENPPIVDEPVINYGHVDVPKDDQPAEEAVTFVDAEEKKVDEVEEEEKPVAPEIVVEPPTPDLSSQRHSEDVEAKASEGSQVSVDESAAAAAPSSSEEHSSPAAASASEGESTPVVDTLTVPVAEEPIIEPEPFTGDPEPAPADPPTDAQHELSTPPPESETSSVASEPNTAQVSPRIDHPEPVAPLDEEDPFAAEPVIPKGDSAPVFALPFAASQPQQEQSSEETQQEQQQHQPHQHTETPTSSAPTQSIDFIDPFAEFDESSSSAAPTPASSLPATPAKQAPTGSSIPATPSTIDYIDPFGEFDSFTPSSSVTATPASSVPATPQKPAAAPSAPAGDDFDPFADLLNPSAPSSQPPRDEDDDDLL